MFIVAGKPIANTRNQLFFFRFHTYETNVLITVFITL